MKGLLSAGLLAVVSWFTAPAFSAAASSPSAAGSGAQAPAGALGVMNFGAIPGCKSDSTDAFNRALKAAASAGGKVFAPGGTYCHDGLIIIPSGVTLSGDGDRTNLRATNRLQKYSISSWTSDDAGKFTLNVSGNSYIYPGFEIYVHDVVRSDQCNPNGHRVAETANATTITFEAVGCRAGSGMGGTVQNTTPGAAVELSGKDASLRNLLITTNWPTSANSPPPGWPDDFPFTPRQADYQASAVFNTANGFVVDHVHVIGSANAGVVCIGCSNGSETSNKVEGSLADGFEHSRCASNIQNSDNIALHTGDDSYSVNSYQNEPCMCSNITFKNDVSDSGLERGFEAAGGQNITYSGGSVNNAAYACIYVYGGSGKTFKMIGTTGVVIENVAVSNCNGPAVYVHSDGDSRYGVSNVTISGITATNVRNYGVQVGDGRNFAQGIKITDSTFTAAPGTDHPGAILAGGGDVTLSKLTFVGFGGACATAWGQRLNSGTLTMDGIECSGINARGSADSAFHMVSTGFANIHLTNSKVVKLQHPLPAAAHFGGETPNVDVKGISGQVTAVHHD